MSEIAMNIDHDAPDHNRAYCMTCDNRGVSEITVGDYFVTPESRVSMLESLVAGLDGVEDHLLVTKDSGELTTDLLDRLGAINHALLDRHERLVRHLIHGTASESLVPRTPEATASQPAPGNNAHADDLTCT